jgi:hypothetical protein
MGVSLAKEPYVQDARPSHDRSAMIGAALLHLQSTDSASALSSSAARVAPRLLALCGLDRDDLESVAPIEWDQDPADRRAALDEALPVLISTLYSPTPCSAHDLRRVVLGVVRPLRAELLDAHRRAWYDDQIALAFADRLWEDRPAGPAARAARTASYGVTLLVALLCAAVALPLILAGMTDRPRLRVAGNRRNAVPAVDGPDTEDGLQSLMAALGDAALLADMGRARSDLRRHVERIPGDRDDARRLEGHLDDFARRVDAAQKAGSMTATLRRESMNALGALIRSMDAVSSRDSMQAAQDLETEIRFIVSAHGSIEDGLALPAGRMAA